MQFDKFTGTMPPAAKAIYNKWRQTIPLSTFLHILAYLYKRNPAAFQYVNGKLDQYRTELAHVTSNNTSLMLELIDYFEKFEAILRKKGMLKVDEIQEEGEE